MTWDTEVLAEPLAQATGTRECGAKVGLAALGGKVADARLERVQDSPNFNGRRFVTCRCMPKGFVGT